MKQQRTFQNPFSDAFIETWQLWKDFRKEEHNFSYKGVISEQMAIKRLCDVSEGDEEKAIRIVSQSISRGWMDFYPLKQPSVNGKSTSKPRKSESKPEPTTSNAEKFKREFMFRNGEGGQQGDNSHLKAV